MATITFGAEIATFELTEGNGWTLDRLDTQGLLDAYQSWSFTLPRERRFGETPANVAFRVAQGTAYQEAIQARLMA